MLRDRLTAGTMIDDGRFEVKRAIKAGGMGAVYEVVDRRLGNKAFALKEMLNNVADYEERQAARERFISEVQVMLTLSHPHIPRVTHQFMHGNSFYFVMDFIRGPDLSQVLTERGNPGLPADQVISWALQILDALHYLHGRTPPIVHRDLKPSNILIRDDDGRAILIDFGIARVTNPGEGLWIGTPGYAPPEQQYGRQEPRSDIYALGATMHELLTGVKPVDFDFATFKELKVDVDPALEAVIREALVPWPDERLQSAAAMSERLRSLANFSISLPGAGRTHNFESDVAAFKEQHLDPLLKALISRFGNECHTRHLPRNLDYLTFTLASSTNFELQVVKDEDRERIRFLEKQGLLEPKLLGEVDPTDPQVGDRARSLVESFVDNYEADKGFSGGMIR